METYIPDRVWDRLSQRTKRDIIQNTMIVHTDKCIYSLGANSLSDCWLLIKKIKGSPVKHPDDDPHICWDLNTEVIDKWR